MISAHSFRHNAGMSLRRYGGEYVGYLFFFKLYLAVVQRLYYGERFHMYSFLSEISAAVLECLFNYETHSDEFRARLLNEFHDAFGSIAVGEEIVDEKHPVVFVQIFPAYDYIVLSLFGERRHRED